jgi:hypothetical protein
VVVSSETVHGNDEDEDEEDDVAPWNKKINTVNTGFRNFSYNGLTNQGMN